MLAHSSRLSKRVGWPLISALLLLVSINVYALETSTSARSIEAQFQAIENSELVGGEEVYREKVATLKQQLDPANAMQQMRFDKISCWYQPDKTTEQLQAAIAKASAWMLAADGVKDIASGAEFQLCRGWFRQLSSDIAGAKSDFNGALNTAELANSRRLIADALSSRGELLGNQGDLAQALEDLQVAHQLYHLLGNRYWAAYTLSMVANTYRRMGDLERAKVLLEEVVKLYEARGDAEGIIDSRYLLALTHDDLGEYDIALSIYMDMLGYYQHKNLVVGQLTSYIAIADNRLRVGDNDAAANALASAEPLIDQNYDPSNWALWHLFSAYLDTANQQFEQALLHLEKAAPIVVNLDNYRYLSWVQKLQSQVFGSLGRWQEAYVSLQEFQKTSDILATKLRDQTSTRLRIEFDVARKEAENQALKAEKTIRESRAQSQKEKRGWQMAVLSLTGILLLFVGYWAVQQYRRSQRLHLMAMTDELTQLPNRRSIYSSGAEEFDQAKRTNVPFSVIAFDVDHFKRINDMWGHDVGDRVLQKIAEYAQLTLRKNDRIGRTGGEEFLVVLPSADIHQATEVAQRLCHCIEEIELRYIADDLIVTISVGVAQLNAEDKELSSLMQRADGALYEAKHAGRNQVKVAL